MFEWLSKNKFNTPTTFDIRRAGWRREGWYIKSRRGRGSIGARQVIDEHEFQRACASEVEFLAQDTCQLPEITIDVFASFQSREVHAICRERLETKSGV